MNEKTQIDIFLEPYGTNTRQLALAIGMKYARLRKRAVLGWSMEYENGLLKMISPGGGVHSYDVELEEAAND